MKKISKLEPQFVTAIPEKVGEGIIYASLEYATVSHLCCCGCGREVVTPLTPTDWKLTYDGQNISMHPSIGNWSFPCQSHYWIRDGQVQWAEQWTAEQIQAGREYDRHAKTRQYGIRSDEKERAATDSRSQGLWARIKRWWQ